jgi:lipopolysaccharide export system permease protein
MRIITRYLIRAHTGPFLFAFSALTGLLFLNAFAQRMDDLVGKGLAWNVIGEFVLLSLPHTIALTLPMAILVSVLYTFSELTAANEITAMAAGGISPLRILLPLLGVGTILAGVMLFFNDQVLPDANHRLKNLIIDISRKSPTFELRERVINEIDTENRDGAVYLQAATIDPATNEMTEVVIYDLTDPSAHRTTYAARGSMAFTDSGGDLYLTLYDGDVLEAAQEGGGAFNRSEFEVQIVPLRGVGDELERQEGSAVRSDREMSITLLRAEVLNRTEELVRIRQGSLELAQSTISDVLGYPDPDLMAANELEPDPLRGRGSVIAGGRRQPFSLRTDDLTQRVALAVRQNLGRVSALQASADQFRVEIHKKYSIAFACIVFVLLGAPLAIRFPRGGVGMVIVASVAIFAVYWAGLIGGENLANEGVVTPFWAMWTADLVFLGLGLALAARMSRTAGTNRGGVLGDVLFNLSSWGHLMATRLHKA